MDQAIVRYFFNKTIPQFVFKMRETETNVYETAIELLGVLEADEEDEDLNESYRLLQNWVDSLPQSEKIFESDSYNIIAQMLIDQRCNNSGLRMCDIYIKLSELGLIRRDLTFIMKTLRERNLIPSIRLKSDNVGRPTIIKS